MLRPDFDGGSLVNLAVSLVAGRGGTPGPYPEARVLPASEVAAASRVVLLLIDGLGATRLARHGGPLQQAVAATLTSVFPSSTAPALTSLYTARGPAQHAITGWTEYLRECGGVVLPLPFQARWGGDLAAAGVQMGPLIGAAPALDSLPLPALHMIPEMYVDSPFTATLSGAQSLRVGYQRLDQGLERLATAVRHAPRGQLAVYYWPQFDALAHAHGIDSAATTAHLQEIEQAILGLAAALAGSDTLLVVTADHGLLDTSPEHATDLAAHPELLECLALPLTGEPRAGYCHVRPGRERQLRDYVEQALGAGYTLHPSADLLEQGWFGRGPADPRLSSRIGDYTLISHGRHIFDDRLPGEPASRLIGVHGGLSEDEMRVPLALFRC